MEDGKVCKRYWIAHLEIAILKQQKTMKAVANVY